MAECAPLLMEYVVISCIVGSNPTTSASKSLISQKNRARFELPVRVAAVRGPWRRAAARAGPGERGLSALSAASQRFSLLANFEVRFSRAIPRLAYVKGHELPLPTGNRVSGC